MKKGLLLVLLVCGLGTSYGSFTPAIAKEKPAVEAKTEAVVKPPVETKEEANRKVMEIVSKMSVKDYETLTGRKLNLFEKFGFKIMKKRFEKQLSKGGNDSEGFNIGGFLLGLLLGLIGVLLAYIFSKDDNFRKWSWIGVGVLVVIILLTAI